MNPGNIDLREETYRLVNKKDHPWRDKAVFQALQKECNYFRCLCNVFPELTDKKLNDRNDGTEIQKIICDNDFISSSTSAVRTAWIAFLEVASNFLGNENSENQRDIAGEILSTSESLRCNQCVNIQFFFSCLKHFPKNLVVSDEQGQRLHQDIKVLDNIK